MQKYSVNNDPNDCQREQYGITQLNYYQMPQNHWQEDCSDFPRMKSGKSKSSQQNTYKQAQSGQAKDHMQQASSL
jgi:hypothetical protein